MYAEKGYMYIGSLCNLHVCLSKTLQQQPLYVRMYLSLSAVKRYSHCYCMCVNPSAVNHLV